MQGNYLIDTCAWLDLRCDPARLNQSVLRKISREATLHLATISLVEVARKAATGALILSESIETWIQSAADPTVIRLQPITPAIAIDAYHLPGGFHKDPADRLILATARCHGLTLLTSDQRILSYPHVRTLASR